MRPCPWWASPARGQDPVVAGPRHALGQQQGRRHHRCRRFLCGGQRLFVTAHSTKGSEIC
jgi:hypothetical protein